MGAGQIHCHLTCLGEVPFAAFRFDGFGVDVVLGAYYVIDALHTLFVVGVVLFDYCAYYAAGQIEVYFGVEECGVGEQRGECAFEVADVGGDLFGYVVYHFGRYFQAVLIDFVLEYLSSQLKVRLFDLYDEPHFEAGEQALFHAFELAGLAVAADDDLFADEQEVVEDVEECVLGFRFADELLYVVDDEHVDALVEVDEVVGLLGLDGIGVLQQEDVGGDVDDAFFGVALFDGYAYRVGEMGFAYGRRAEDEEGVEDRFAGMGGDVEPGAAGELVALAFYEVVEGVFWVE